MARTMVLILVGVVGVIGFAYGVHHLVSSGGSWLGSGDGWLAAEKLSADEPHRGPRYAPGGLGPGAQPGALRHVRPVAARRQGQADPLASPPERPPAGAPAGGGPRRRGQARVPVHAAVWVRRHLLALVASARQPERDLPGRPDLRHRAPGDPHRGDAFRPPLRRPPPLTSSRASGMVIARYVTVLRERNGCRVQP